MSYLNVKSYLGENARLNLDEIFQVENVQKILLICGKQSFEKSGAKKLLTPFLQDKTVQIFNDFSANPKIEDVEKAVNLINNILPDIILAVGGGSALDLAKAAKALCFIDMPLQEAVKQGIVSAQSACPLVAIPTTAGTGSEATHFSVIYINHKKYSLADSAMLPNYSIIDPAFSNNMPLYLRAVTGMDALCQAIESYWSVSATVQSQEIAIKAIALIKTNFILSMQDDKKARAKMAEAAFYAGQAINQTKTTAPHALSYWLTTKYNIPHGHAVALNLPRFIWAHGQTQFDQYSPGMTAKQHQQNMIDLYNVLECDDAQAVSNWVVSLMKDIGLKVSWDEFGLEAKIIAEELARECNPERMSNNPVIFAPEQLRALIEKKI